MIKKKKKKKIEEATTRLHPIDTFYPDTRPRLL
jgi:hypothetical protein